MKRIKFWQKTYLATLTLFLACLLGVILAVFQVGRQQSWNSTQAQKLNVQHYFVQSLARDAVVLRTSRPGALPKLYEYYAEIFAADGYTFALYQGGEAVYSNLPMELAADAPECTVQADKRVYLVRQTPQGKSLYIGTTLSGGMADTAVVCAVSVEDFYTEWQRIGTLFFFVGGGVSVLFALVLYFVLGSLNRPLARLTATAQEIAAGDLSARAPEQRKDEIGELAQSMNQMAAKVETQVQQLKTEAEAKQQLVDNLAHEMRTPLTAVSGWAQTIRNTDLSSGELVEATDIILFESNRLLVLSRQLLKLSVLRHEQLEMEEVKLSQLFDHVLRTLQPKARQKNVLLYIGGHTESTVRGDEALLESLFINLCDNAVKACAQDGQVYLQVEKAEKQLTVSITDNGRGMSEETLAHIGQAFYRADKARSRKEGGAGLGLSLCYAICAKHSAQLAFTSAKGKGTIATVTFTT